MGTYGHDRLLDEVTWIRKRLGWLLFWITLPWWLAALAGLWFVATWAHYR